MEITSITRENMAFFKHLATADAFEMIGLYRHYAIGALTGERPKLHPAGLLIYHLIRDEDENYISIDSLFIDERDRRQGIGSSLIEALAEAASGHGVECLCADLPVEGLDDLKALLEKDFVSVCMDVSICEDSTEKLRSMLSLPMGLSAKEDEIITLEEADFGRVCRDIRKGFKEQYVSELQSLLRYPEEYFEAQVSTLHVNKSGVYDAFLLLHNKPSGRLVAELYSVSDKAGESNELALIINEALELVFYKYGGDALIQFNIRNEEAGERIGIFLPDLPLRVVKRYARSI